MSLALAAGWALSSCQSVSVVPMIQWRPHGMTNRTLFSVRRIRPAVDLDAVARDDEVDALGGADLELAALADQVLEVVGPHPGRVDHLAGLDVELLVGEVVEHAHAGHALALAQEADDRRARGDGGAVGGGGARDGERVAGVVDLRVPVLEGADQRVGLERRRDLQRLALGQVAMAVQALAAAHLVVEQHPGADVEALPEAAGRAGRGTARGARGAARSRSAAGRARAAPRGRARTPAARGSAGRRGSACSSGSRCRRRSRAPPAARPTGRGWRRRARSRCPSRRRR